jgi:hypothetical protein
MNGRQGWRVLVAAFLIAGGCTLIPPDPNPQRNTIDYKNSVRAESLRLARNPDTTYVRRTNDLIRRSRLVPTDSLARLRVALEAAPDSVKWRYRQVIICEYARLMRLHGNAAAQRAIYRMLDSLQSTGFGIDEDRMHRGGGPPQVLSRRACGDATWDLPGLPDSLNSVPLANAHF